MKRKILRLISILTILALLSGCKGGSDGNQTGSGSGSQSSGSNQNNGGSQSSTGEEKSLQEEAGDALTFDAMDLDGNSVSSQVFGQSRLTLLNVWGTFCQPCLQEMPGLGSLAASYNSADFQIIGVLCDVEEGATDDIEYAKELVEQTGANYVHLAANQSLADAFLSDVTAVPTTYFVDSKGAVLDVKVGSRSEDQWKKLVDEYLAQL